MAQVSQKSARRPPVPAPPSNGKSIVLAVALQAIPLVDYSQLLRYILDHPAAAASFSGGGAALPSLSPGPVLAWLLLSGLGYLYLGRYWRLLGAVVLGLLPFPLIALGDQYNRIDVALDMVGPPP